MGSNPTAPTMVDKKGLVMAEKSFTDQITEFRQAGFSCLMVCSKEEQIAEAELVRALHRKEARTERILRFSVASALQCLVLDKDDNSTIDIVDPKMTEPDALLAALPKILTKKSEDSPTSAIILPDFCVYLRADAVLRRMFRERIWWARNVGHQIILLTESKIELPDLMNDLTVVYHNLPDRETTQKSLKEMAKQYKVPMAPEEEERCVESLVGMTSMAQSDAIALAIISSTSKPKKIDPKILQENKEREISRRGYLNIVKPNVNFDNVIGHSVLKDWARVRRRAYTRKAKEFGIESPKGIMLVGPPGTGKTLFAKAITNEWQMPLLQLRFSALFSSMLGDTESNVRSAIEIAERMAPCILWADEINRAFGGGHGERDGGTQERVTGEFLTWLSEKTSQVFVLATANDVTGMPAEMLRKGRWDEIWSVSTPSAIERKSIFDLYLKGKKNDVNTQLAAESTDTFIPAEIEAICKSAHLRAFDRFTDGGDDVIHDEDIVYEIKGTVPLAKSMAEQFEKLKEWAEKNARSTTERETVEANTVRRLNVTA